MKSLGHEAFFLAPIIGLLTEDCDILLEKLKNGEKKSWSSEEKGLCALISSCIAFSFHYLQSVPRSLFTSIVNLFLLKSFC